MFKRINIEPKIGDVAFCYGNVVIRNGYPHIERIIGVIKKIKHNAYIIEDIDYEIPKYRVEKYLFGGIEMKNNEYNPVRINEEVIHEIEYLKNHCV